MKLTCETCSNRPTTHVAVLDMSFCDDCLSKIDHRINELTAMTPRTITDHKVNGLNEDLHIKAVDDPGPGGANHIYSIAYGFNPGTDVGGSQEKCRIQFQNGPVKDAGINGVSNEAIIAVAIDRMRGFQFQRKEDGTFDESKRGTYACKENACALTHLEEALMWLQKRTRDRMARGVEGTMKV